MMSCHILDTFFKIRFLIFMKTILKTPSLAVLIGLIMAVSGHAQSFLTNGLVAYYPFSGNANDMAGTNNGVSYGATLTTDCFGNPNSAYLFNGSSSYIKTDYPMQDLTNATFSFWFYANRIVVNETLLSDSDTAAGNDCNIQFWNRNVIGIVVTIMVLVADIQLRMESAILLKDLRIIGCISFGLCNQQTSRFM